MKPFLKTIAMTSLPVLAAASLGASVDLDTPATRPATQPAASPAQTVASNNSPLVIPDGTSGPVARPNDEYDSGSGVLRQGVRG